MLEKKCARVNMKEGMDTSSNKREHEKRNAHDGMSDKKYKIRNGQERIDKRDWGRMDWKRGIGQEGMDKIEQKKTREGMIKRKLDRRIRGN